MGLLSGQLTQRSGASEGPRAPLPIGIRCPLGAGRWAPGDGDGDARCPADHISHRNEITRLPLGQKGVRLS
jgi:hypothetical protein